MEFDWDEHNPFHIAMHGVTQDEVESALRGDPLFVQSEIRNFERGLSLLEGRTMGVS